MVGREVVVDGAKPPWISYHEFEEHSERLIYTCGICGWSYADHRTSEAIRVGLRQMIEDFS